MDKWGQFSISYLGTIVYTILCVPVAKFRSFTVFDTVHDE